MVEVFWSVAMVVFETFQPIRLAEMLGSEEQAGALMGPVASAGWAVFAAGSALAGLARAGSGRAHGHPGQGAELARGDRHGAGRWPRGPHRGIPGHLWAARQQRPGPRRPAPPRGRVPQPGHGALDELDDGVRGVQHRRPLLGVLAEGTSNQVAMVTAGAVSLIGVLCYLPALRRERETRRLLLKSRLPSSDRRGDRGDRRDRSPPTVLAATLGP